MQSKFFKFINRKSLIFSKKILGPFLSRKNLFAPYFSRKRSPPLNFFDKVIRPLSTITARVPPINFDPSLRDRSKFTAYLGQVLGKIQVKKVSFFVIEKSLRPLIFSKKTFSPLFLVEKNSSPPFLKKVSALLILLEKKSAPPFFFSKKVLAPSFNISSKNSNMQSHENQSMYFNCMYHTPINTLESLDPPQISYR